MHRILKDPLQCSNNAGEDGYAEGDMREMMIYWLLRLTISLMLVHSTRREVNKRDDTDSMIHTSIANKSIGS
jgi:hypothetical protein